MTIQFPLFAGLDTNNHAECSRGPTRSAAAPSQGLIGSANFQALKFKLKTNSDFRAATHRCPLCDSNVEDRIVTLFRGLIRSLYEIYKWCGKNGRNEFETKEIKHLLGKNEYARFGDLVRFGGLVYKPKEAGKSRKALFGLNMTRTREFFAGARKIPLQIILNQITNEIEEARYVTVSNFPELNTLINSEGLYEQEAQWVIWNHPESQSINNQ